MKLLVLIAFISLPALGAPKLKDLSIEKIAQGTCGTLAAAMTERVYNTNKEMQQEYYKTPVFDKDADFEMMRYLKLLATESDKFTAETKDSTRLSSMMSAFMVLKKKQFGFVRDCLKLYRPLSKQCFHRYKLVGKSEADHCIREKVNKTQETNLVKLYFLRLKSP